MVSEFAQGQDLDGNGMLLQEVLRLMEGGVTSNLGLPGKSLDLTEQLLVVAAKQLFSNRDLNGDGVISGNALQIYDSRPRQTSASAYSVFRSGLLSVEDNHSVFFDRSEFMFAALPR